VSRWKAIISLFCLAVWLPATQHCQLENLPGLAFLQCTADTEGQPDCSGDSCDVVERGAYKVPDSSDVAAAFSLALLEGVSILVAEPAEVVVATPDVGEAVALLPEAWQSYSVVAVPIRGPSFSS
jgi:hypothetical protein